MINYGGGGKALAGLNLRGAHFQRRERDRLLREGGDHVGHETEITTRVLSQIDTKKEASGAFINQ